ncbi:MAG: TrmH family RNA methyltransferase [Acidimicrobiales bacterium]
MAALAASNPRVRRLRRLSGRRSARVDDAAFILEGPVLIAEALEDGVALEGLYVESGVASLEELVDLARRCGVPVHELSSGTVAGITDSVTPRPALAVVPLPSTDLAPMVDESLATGRPLLVLVDVRDPGNVGTIVRAAVASGAAGVVCCRGTADPWSPKVVRSSAGAVLRIALSCGHEPAAVLAELDDRGVATVATVVSGGTDPVDLDLGGAAALVFGNEASGLDAEVAAQCAHRATIAMDGRTESLNVAMAATVVCFEASRQRRAGASGDAMDWTPAAPDDKVNRP